MSGWKLVEAESEQAELPPSEQVEITDKSAGRGGRGRGRGNGSNPAGGRGGGRGRGRFNGNYRTRADRSYFAYLAVQQMYVTPPSSFAPLPSSPALLCSALLLVSMLACSR